VGALFLLHNWRPAFDPGPILWTYWPLILIFVGIGKIWDSSYRSRNPNAAPAVSIGASVGAVAFVAVLVLLFWHGRSFSHRRGFDTGSHHNVQTVDLQGAKSAHATLDIAAGQLTINGGASHMLEADFKYSEREGKPQVSYQGDELEISQEGKKFHFGHTENTWNLRLGDNIPMELKVDMGAGQSEVKVGDLAINRLEMHMGAGQVIADLTGNWKDDLEATIQGGVGHAVILLPEDVGVRVHATGGIGSINADKLQRNADEYTNDLYGKSPVNLRLEISGGIGNIELRPVSKGKK